MSVRTDMELVLMALLLIAALGVAALDMAGKARMLRHGAPDGPAREREKR